MTYIPASDLHHCGSGFMVHLACLLTAKNMSVCEETGNVVCLTPRVYLCVELKVLSPQRQTAKAKSADKQCIFPQLCHNISPS